MYGFYAASRSSHNRCFRGALGPVAEEQGLPLADALSEEEVERAMEEEGAAFGEGGNAIYTAPLVLWAFLSQVLGHGVQRSCQAAVHRIIVLCLCRGVPAPSPDTGAYCRARAKLPLPLIERLAVTMAHQVERDIPNHWRWRGKRTWLADGTNLTAADTPENQRLWPQPRSQKPGVGFPRMRTVGLFSLATGMLAGLAEGPYRGKQTGENALLRKLLHHLQEGDVLVADCYYCSYMMIAQLQQRGVDAVMKLHHRRQFEFTEQQRLRGGDLLVTWQRPPRPSWMDEETYQSIPEELTIRLTEVQVRIKGFRVKTYVTATTLTDMQEFPSDSFGELYYQRWHVELDIRNLKTTMCLEHLVCKTPDMVRKELWMHWLAYNVVRRQMARAVLAGDVAGMAGLGGAWANRVWNQLGKEGENVAPQANQYRGESPVRYLSFAGALQITAQTWLAGALLTDRATQQMLLRINLLVIASGRLPDRPYRVEPRAVKRRPKQYKLLTEPRRQARTKLCAEETAA